MAKKKRTKRHDITYKQHTDDYRLRNTNPTKIRGELRCSGRVTVPAPPMIPTMNVQAAIQQLEGIGNYIFWMVE